MRPRPAGRSVTPIEPAPPTPQADVLDRVLKLSGSRTVPVRVACAPFADCHGTVALAARGRTLGSSSFEIPLEQAKTVQVKLSKAAGKRLKRRKERVVVTITLADQASATVKKTLRAR